MSVRILAIDPGTCCGYAVMDVPQPVPQGILPVRDTAGLCDLREKFDGFGMRCVRLRKFIVEVEPDFIVFEQINFPQKSTAAAHLYGALIGVITTYGIDNGIDCHGILTNELKRRATGKGGGKGTDKPAIVAAANKTFKIDPPLDDTDSATNKEHNIADAMWLMQIALEEYAHVVKAKNRGSK